MEIAVEIDMEAARQFYIDGRWVDPVSADLIDVINPASEQVIGTIAAGGAADVDRAVAAARRAFPGYSQTSKEERIALLERVLKLVNERASRFAETLTSEMGVATTFANTAQIPFAAAHIQVALDVLRRYEFVVVNGSAAIVREPIGVCGLITPWNWPLYQITAKVAPALAAGCTVVLKPSELSPFNALLFAQVMHDAGTPPGVFNLVNGTGDAVGAAISSHPDVDMVSITGSTRAGVLVAQAAAPTVKRVTQELGGKSPNILLDDANFDTAVPLGVMAGFRNVGQSCSAPTRMLVPAQRLDEVESLAKKAVAAITVGDPRLPQTTLGPVANRAQFERIQAMIGVGLDEGAKLICGGLGRPADLAKGFFVRPTIFSAVKQSMRIAQEEIFGPVLCIIPYASEAEAVEIANDTIYGLGSHIQSRNVERARRIAMKIRAGQVHLNYPAWDGTAAFGGFKRSGNGREYGVLGFEEYLEAKSIVGY